VRKLRQFLTNSLSYIRSFKTITLHYPELSSTNDLARQLFDAGDISHGTAIRADFQASGKGQMGETWQGESGENIYMSLVLELQLPAEKQFLVNMAVSLAVLHTLKTHLPKASIKWPNDIYNEGRKLAGILIENSLQGSLLTSSIIGIGINVNQKNFGPLTKAASLFSFTNSVTPLKEVYDTLISQLEWQLASLAEEWRIWQEYHEKLLFYGSITTFQANGRLFKGRVKGVDQWGRLEVEENQEVKQYAIKEIQWIDV